MYACMHYCWCLMVRFREEIKGRVCDVVDMSLVVCVVPLTAVNTGSRFFQRVDFSGGCVVPVTHGME